MEDGRLVHAVACTVVIRHGKHEGGRLAAKCQHRPPPRLVADTPPRGRIEETPGRGLGTGDGDGGHITGIRGRLQYSGDDCHQPPVVLGVQPGHALRCVFI
jgi:hypothetical protein